MERYAREFTRRLIDRRPRGEGGSPQPLAVDHTAVARAVGLTDDSWEIWFSAHPLAFIGWWGVAIRESAKRFVPDLLQASLEAALGLGDDALIKGHADRKLLLQILGVHVEKHEVDVTARAEPSLGDLLENREAREAFDRMRSALGPAPPAR
jgi:hypothetical protein